MEVKEIRNALDAFFSKKMWYCGGPIPQSLIHNDRNFRLIDNITLVQAVILGYKSIAKAKSLANTKYTKDCDVELCLKVIRDCERLRIPQDAIGGIFLIYLELCEKVELL